ncbi:hypothetical protein [Xenorhabdus sp. KJ12.1]|uniref:hypothetical protein n=1 Tax=Xenorhabdus sp. KJ12.1 TaxID=1851571 RepID=UPI00128FFAEC|nr:hypothetical protein [Xenorhabdus sp. KJ12.1]
MSDGRTKVDEMNSTNAHKKAQERLEKKYQIYMKNSSRKNEIALIAAEFSLFFTQSVYKDSKYYEIKRRSKYAITGGSAHWKKKKLSILIRLFFLGELLLRKKLYYARFFVNNEKSLDLHDRPDGILSARFIIRNYKTLKKSENRKQTAFYLYIISIIPLFLMEMDSVSSDIQLYIKIISFFSLTICYIAYVFSENKLVEINKVVNEQNEKASKEGIGYLIKNAIDDKKENLIRDYIREIKFQHGVENVKVGHVILGYKILNGSFDYKKGDKIVSFSGKD